VATGAKILEAPVATPRSKPSTVTCWSALCNGPQTGTGRRPSRSATSTAPSPKALLDRPL